MATTSPEQKRHEWTTSDRIAILALLVSVAAAGFAVFQTQRANEISESAYSLSEALAPKVDVFVNSIDASLGEREETGESELRVELELVNTGQVHLSGCTTRWQGTDEAGQPSQYLSVLAEPGGETWDVEPGDKHVSVKYVALSSIPAATPEAASTHIAVWFECESAALVTSGFLYGVDLAAGRLIPAPGNDEAWESHAPIRELAPLGWFERAVILGGGSFPYPSPVPTPQFTLRGAEGG
ncbi:hypothetical protein AB0N73_11830 [Microbacterium sp. NPDC089189]|uniref:hypothetical protein n=1 Tax=Microbacterium sp. NPDC089189 TaxID=3154972 RepID=UPI003417914D